MKELQEKKKSIKEMKFDTHRERNRDRENIIRDMAERLEEIISF